MAGGGGVGTTSAHSLHWIITIITTWGKQMKANLPPQELFSTDVDVWGGMNVHEVSDLHCSFKSHSNELQVGEHRRNK